MLVDAGLLVQAVSLPPLLGVPPMCAAAALCIVASSKGFLMCYKDCYCFCLAPCWLVFCCMRNFFRLKYELFSLGSSETWLLVIYDVDAEIVFGDYNGICMLFSLLESEIFI